MGSAAPSVRRWLTVALLVAVGVGTAVFWPSLDDVEPPVEEGRPEAEVVAGFPDATTVSLELEPGRSVPQLHTDPVAAGSDTVDLAHDHGPVRLTAGDDTVGATIDVPEMASMFIVHGASTRTVSFRFAHDGGWTDWEDLSMGADESPDGLEGDEGHGARSLAGAPVAVPADAIELDLVVAGGDTSSFDVTFLDLGVETGLPDPAGATIGPGFSAQLGAPVIFERSQWATAGWDYQNGSCDDGPSVSDQVRAVVVHHTVTTNNYSEAAVVDLLRAIHYSHTVINGWCDIGYNFVVDRFGRIWEARTGSIAQATIGGHSRGFNTSTVGVALLGQHHPGASPAAASVSAESQAAVQAVAHWKLGVHGVDPAGKVWLRNRSTRPPLRLAGESWHYVPTVLNHRDLGVTSCPGNHGADLVAALPARLAADRDVTLPYRFADWQAHSHGPGFVTADAFGGIRPAGAATPWSPAPAGFSGGDSALAVGGDLAGGYLLASSGTVVGYGSAPAVGQAPAGTAAIDLAVAPGGRAGWVLDTAGSLRGFGGAGDLSPGAPVQNPVAAALAGDGRGYVVAVDGGLHPVGGAPAATIESPLPGGVRAVDIDVIPGTSGQPAGWVLDETGRLHGFGGAATTRVIPTEAVVAVAAADPGPGGWVLDKHGQLWPYGGAPLIFPVSTNATAANAVDVDNVGAVYSPAFLNAPTSRFVASAYGLFLGREPSVVELDQQVTKLEQGSKRSQLTGSLATSDFWAGARLDQMYQDVLGRPPDAAGRAYWLAEIESGLTLADLGTYFYGSQEYANAAGSTERYVTGLYNVLLDRPPDADGLNYWVGVLQSGQAAPPDVANGFYASIESRRDRARVLHRQIFGADPDGESAERWAEQLLATGDVGVAAEMAASYDYYRLAVDGP